MRKFFAPVLVLTALMFAYSPIAIANAPYESTMLLVQKIFYYHFPTWIALTFAVTVCTLASAVYLFKGTPAADRLAFAAAEVTVVFGLFGLVSGSLWGRKAWGVWWQWDARLTMAFLLELIFGLTWALVPIVVLGACVLVVGPGSPLLVWPALGIGFGSLVAEANAASEARLSVQLFWPALLAVLAGACITAAFVAAASHGTPAAAAGDSCQLGNRDGRIKHVIYLQFDNTHYRRDRANVFHSTWRIGSPSGPSSFTTSAPWSRNSFPAYAHATPPWSSRTRRPSSALTGPRTAPPARARCRGTPRWSAR